MLLSLGRGGLLDAPQEEDEDLVDSETQSQYEPGEAVHELVYSWTQPNRESTGGSSAAMKEDDGNGLGTGHSDDEGGDGYDEAGQNDGPDAMTDDIGNASGFP